MDDTYLIIGATGFVGSNITRELVKRNKKVSVITRNRKLNWRTADISSKLDIYECDILSFEDLKKCFKKIKPDYIFHTAAYGVMPSEDNRERMIDVNIKGTINIINAAQQLPFKLFINTGTCVEYGLKDKKMDEADVLEPINDYGIAKAASTLYCRKEGYRSGLPIVTFRLFTPYGYYEDKSRLIPSVILSVLNNSTIRVSSASSVRDFIFIEDVVSSYISSANLNFSPGEIINIGTGKQHSIREVVENVRRIYKSDSIIEWGAVSSQTRFIEPKRWEANTRKSKKIFKTILNNSFEEGLTKTINWFEKNRKLYEE